ncbi:cation diffusion facilitator family transporter [Kaarinaea lacus]
MKGDKHHLERRALIVSVIGTIIMAALGIGFSVLTQSNAILLDGIFSLIGFATALVALRISTLVQQPDDTHYQFGYGSFEPLFNLLKGVVIGFIAVFAFTDSINSILSGGRAIQAGTALVYAVVVGIACFIVAFYLRAMAKKTLSPLVELDAKNWIIDGLLTVAVLIAFVATIIIEKSEYAWMAVYADPAIVAILVILTLPVPYITIRDNMRQLLLAAPNPQMQSKVHDLLEQELESIPKEDYLVRMTQVGRFLYMQIYLLFTPQSVVNNVSSHDAIRQRLNDTLVAEFPNVSVDVVFTLERKWFGNVTESK